MGPTLATLAQSVALAYASGISLYATIALVGIAERWGWVTQVPTPIDRFASPWIIGIAFTLTVVEFLATLVPGVASAWDAVHSLIRPPAAAAMAVLVAWHGDATMILAAGLLGGSIGLATHATKLGVRLAVDSSPEPITNAMANSGELATVGLIVAFVWAHPYMTLAGAMVALLLAWLLVRTVWRTIRSALGSAPPPTTASTGEWRAPRTPPAG
jgi:hypothetical protein